jgi:hypothetical protein
LRSIYSCNVLSIHFSLSEDIPADSGFASFNSWEKEIWVIKQIEKTKRIADLIINGIYGGWKILNKD